MDWLGTVLVQDFGTRAHYIFFSRWVPCMDAVWASPMMSLHLSAYTMSMDIFTLHSFIFWGLTLATVYSENIWVETVEAFPFLEFAFNNVFKRCPFAFAMGQLFSKSAAYLQFVLSFSYHSLLWLALPTFSFQKTQCDLKTGEQQSYYSTDKTIFNIPYLFHHSMAGWCSKCAWSLPSCPMGRLMTA